MRCDRLKLLSISTQREGEVTIAGLEIRLQGWLPLALGGVDDATLTCI